MSLSRELSRGSVVTSQKIFGAVRNGGGLAAKALYDDVYGGTPEFVTHSLSPRPEDYREIFGSFYVSRASSIPILDLPPADETDVFFDVRSSSFDYAEVFGGLDYQDFAVTYDELTKQSNERNGHSPEEARNPAENESLSDNSDDSTKTQCIFNGDSNLSCDGRTEFSESCHRAYQSRKEDMSNGITHVTQISEVPEVTYLVDGTNSLDQDDEIQPLHVNDDGYFNIDLSMGHIEGKQTKKTIMQQPPNAVYERQNFENDPQTPKGSEKSNTHLNRSFITISEISLRTEPSQVPPPSRPPPIIGAKKTHHYKLNSDSNHVFPEGISHDSSPPFFDVEVDASSSAAASAEAMKDVMEEARAKLLSAKEMIERKKKGVGTCTKPHSRYDMKDKEGSVCEMLDQSNNDDNEIKLSAVDKTKIVIETAEENQVSLRGEKLSIVANKSAEKLRNYIDDPREWKEGAGFFELKPDHFRKASDLVKNGDIMIHLSGRTAKTEQDIVIEALEKLGGNDKKIETVLNVHFDKKQREKVGGEIDWQEEEKMRSQTDTELYCQTEYELSKVTICNYDLEETERKNKITKPSVEKKGISGADKSVKYEVLVEVKHKDNKGEAEQTKAQVNDEKKGKVISERKDNENKIKESCRVKENELGDTEGIKHLEMKGKLKGSFERTKGEKGLKKIPRQNENGRMEETLDHLVTEKRLQDDIPEGNDVKPPKKTSDILDGKTHGEDEENGKKDIHEWWENILITHGKHSGEKESKQEPEEVEGRDSSKMGVKEAVEHVKIEVTIGNVGNECRRMFEDLDRVELVKFNGIHVGTESCQKTKKIKSTESAQVQMEMGLNKLRTEVSEVDNEYKAMKQHCKRDESIEKVEATQGCLGYKESGDKISECKINNTQLDDARMLHLGIDENVNAVYRGEEEFKHLECQVGTENINESLSFDDNGSITEMNLSSETKYCNQEADKDVPMASNLKPSGIGCELKVLGDNLIISKEAKSPAMEESGNQVKEVGTRTGHQRYVRVKNTSKLVSFRQYQDSKYDQERGEQGKALNLELNKDKFVPTEVDKERIEKDSKCETNAKPTSERKENNLNLASEVNAGRSTVRRDGEKNTERVKREQELENDRLRKMEEEREREREREKDRMIVDRTTLEGRKADIEVHAEKAAMEGAIADAQQRAMLEARERLEKACAEAREKSLAGKAVLEARVRAERAAVERANVEARERAFEKAVAEKSVFESRERIERSFSDKLSASSRNTGIRQSSSFYDTADIRTQSTLESSGSRYTHSSSNGEIREGIKGESAQRCKARLERHRRIAERAANALAEKNMRDLLALREQVERSRLAETLNADIRRWSSGKEGNLRALLSTLQYILWPDSGWQPIPLTEVITTAAVKKAYRKATLCVHPDKLQQRGASIQQKYICEKVFDLLKEAWNKFCSEER